jgi:hypothetical protein
VRVTSGTSSIDFGNSATLPEGSSEIPPELYKNFSEVSPASSEQLDEDQAGERRLVQAKRQRQRENQKARKVAEREALAAAQQHQAVAQAESAPPQAPPVLSGRRPRPAPLDLYNSFGVLGEAFMKQKTYADRVRLPSPPSQSPVGSETLEDPVSDLEVVQTPDKPSTSRRG